MKILSRLKKAITPARKELLSDMLSKGGLGIILASTFAKPGALFGVSYGIGLGFVLLVFSLILKSDKEEK